MLLLVASGAIILEAVRRFDAPQPVAETTVIWVALGGIAINGGTALGFMAGRKNDLNIRGAFLHMMTDALVSLGVVVSGLVVLATGWQWVDPAVSVTIAIVIVAGTWSLLKDSINLALDAVPEGIDPTAVKDYLCALPEIAEIHHLHVWGLSTTECACTAHLVKHEPNLDDKLLQRIAAQLHDRFGIEHTTIQFEFSRSPVCPTEPAVESVELAKR